MYAIIKTGGKQYKVSNGDTLQVEKLEGNAGDKVSLGEVLAVNDGKATKVGTPLVSGASVSAEIVEQGRADKVIIFKKKRRHNYRRKLGHRQMLTTLKIIDVAGKGAAAPAKKAEAKPAVEKKEAAEKKAPAKKPAAKKAAPKKETASTKTTAAKKPAAKKAPAKKPAAKKPAAKKADKE